MAHNKLVQSEFMLCISGDDYFKKGNIYDVGTIMDKVARKGRFEHGLQAFDFALNTDIVKNCQKDNFPLFIKLDGDFSQVVNINLNMDRYSDLMQSINNLTFKGFVYER